MKISAFEEQRPRCYVVIDVESYVRSQEAHERYQEMERQTGGRRSRRGYSAETDPARTPRWPFQEIVCASAMVLTEHAQGNLQVMNFETFSGPDLDERGVVEALFQVMADAPPGAELVSWQGAAHDIPLILRASLKHGVTLPRGFSWLRWGGERRVEHIDLARYLSGGLKMRQVHMAEYAAAIGVPAKMSAPPAAVARLARQGHWHLVREICEGDVITTALILAHWRQLSDGRTPIAVATDRLLRQIIERRPMAGYAASLRRLRTHDFRHRCAEAVRAAAALAPWLVRNGNGRGETNPSSKPS